MKIPFGKPATTHAQQVALLQRRGMMIDDPAEAEACLRHLNYYHLAAYWLPFEQDHTNHIFRPGSCFADVMNLYAFDRALRLHVLDAIERLEVSMRSQWAYQLAHRYGPHAHLDVALAFKPHLWRLNLDKLAEEVGRSDEMFIKHLKATYAEPLPPVWAVCEVMTLGLLSRWYNNLKPMPARRAIAMEYGVDEKVWESWLRHLSLVRNTCAHHCRLWNREFTITPVLPRNKPAALRDGFQHGSRKLYNSLVILTHCMRRISPKQSWCADLKKLITQYAVPVQAMGFPHGWERMEIWRAITA
ncbi:Abi family protein [Cupriavidus sp. DB3]|uniref:Abi family protein n=1 Tax=Cupriavidus sp. DB3 TaxID=2873259 RepID=UPI001CF1302D|nr:Abi family protein [Cupriavidus sp. DB3]MCA7084664.1 Abi family protein [Cupriavidus sp. DB3]